MLAVALSGVLACAAHFLAKTIRAAIDARADSDGRGEARLQLAVGLFSAVAVVGLVVMMGFTRGESFKEITALTGGAFGDPVLTGLDAARAAGHAARHRTRRCAVPRRTATPPAACTGCAARHAAGNGTPKPIATRAPLARAALDQQLRDLPELANAVTAQPSASSANASCNCTTPTTRRPPTSPRWRPPSPCEEDSGSMITRTFTAAALVAALALSGCGSD